MNQGSKLIVLSLLALCTFAKASSLNESLIQKLEIVHKSLAPSDPQKVAISLRLGDLISEQARLKAQAEFDATGAFGVESAKMRKRALGIYSGVLPRLEGAQKARVLLQMGYLAELLQDASLAQKYFLDVTSVSQDKGVQGEAYLALAENLFRSRKFAMALEAYQKSLELPIQRRGYAQFRKAWSLYNLGEIKQANQEMMDIFKNPEMLRPVQSANSSDIDIEFFNEVARDWSLFLAKRGGLSKAEVEAFSQLVKRGNYVEHLQSLGFEAQRLGQMSDVITVWSYLYSIGESPSVRSQAQSYITEGYLGLGQKVQALAALKLSLQEWSDEPGGCHGPTCLETQKRNRGLILNWHKTENVKPSKELVAAYQEFYKIHPSDLEMGEWLATILDKTGESALSRQLYLSLALKHEDPDARERLLLLALDSVEKSNDVELKQEGRKFYLTHSLNQTQVWPVTYQVNKYYYDIKNFAEAQSRLKTFVETDSAPQDLRLLSAHLHLDVLAEQHLDQDVVNVASSYSKLFPQNRSEFVRIQNKAVLNLVAKIGVSDALAALDNLDNSLSVNDLSTEEMALYLKNKVVLLTQLKRLAEARQALVQFAILKSISKDDQKWAKVQRLALAEAAFDFEEALVALKDLPNETSEYYLKMALFADVTKKESSEPHLIKAFQLATEPGIKKALFFDLLVRVSKPAAWIESNLTWLQSVDSDSVGRAFVIAHNLSKEGANLKRGFAVTDRSSAWSQLIWRYQFLSDFVKQRDQVAAHKLESSHDKLLQKSIKKRVALLNQLEKSSALAIEQKDWAAQLIVLSAVSQENSRFYEELMSLAIPEGLTEDEVNQYMTLLSQQASPFQKKAALVSEKVQELWAKENWDKEYKEVLVSRPETQKLLSFELKILQSLTKDEDAQSLVASILSTIIGSQSESSPDEQLVSELEKARQEVKQDPFDFKKQVKLIDLERSVGNPRLADYLEAKLKTVEQRAQ